MAVVEFIMVIKKLKVKVKVSKNYNDKWKWEIMSIQLQSISDEQILHMTEKYFFKSNLLVWGIPEKSYKNVAQQC